MKIALVQLASPAEETPEERRERAHRLVAEQAQGADLVVLPELWAAGYFAFDAYPERAEPLDGPTVATGRALARELGAYVHVGSLVERANDRLYNTAVLLRPNGDIAHTYRKVHVFGYASREAELLTPGDELAVVETDFGPVGATTCYDLRFPELWRGLIDRGARIVIVPAAWPSARREHWRLFTTTRAIEEQVLLIGCNAAGQQDGGVELAGHSRVVDPWGTVLAEAGAEESVTFCTADPSIVEKVRAEFPVLADRRWGTQ